MSESPRSPEPPRHRFAPGQEEEARAFLRRPTEFETYSVIADRVALWMLFCTVPLGLALWLEERRLAQNDSPPDASGSPPRTTE